MLGFCRTLAGADGAFQRMATGLLDDPSFRRTLGVVDPQVASLAIGKSFLSRLGLASLRRLELDPGSLPWSEEASIAAAGGGLDEIPASPIDALIRATREYWDVGLERLREASRKVGRGQHVVVNDRVRSLVDFLESSEGQRLRELWVAWRSLRDSVRARFCLNVEGGLSSSTSAIEWTSFSVGPRARDSVASVERSSRTCGTRAHAWSHHEYGDERNMLLHKYVLWLQALEPTVFLFENVAHFASTLRTPAGSLDAPAVLSEAIDDLTGHDLHYSVSADIVRAKRHAVPQDRERFVMIGTRTERSGQTAPTDVLSLAQEPSEVPLTVALQGLDAPGVFRFDKRNESASPRDHRNCYTLSYL